MRHELWNQVFGRVDNQVKDGVVWDQVGWKVRSQLGDKVDDQVWDQVYNQVWGQIEENSSET